MADRSKSLPNLASELYQMVIDYLKQETIVPIKALGRFVLWGLAGAVLLAISSVLLLIAALRALQFEAADVFDGNLSFLPYFIVLAAAVAVAAVAASRIGAGPRNGRP